MATRPFSGCCCACSSSLTTVVVVLQLHCELGAPRFPASQPRLMQLPFLLAFLSLLSLAHFHLLSTAAAEEVSISPKLFIYESVADSLIQAASDAQESSFLHTNLPEEEHDHILIADDGVHKKVPTPAEPFRYDSVAASLHAGASCTQGRHVQSGNVSSFTHEAAEASHQTTAHRDNIWQITRASMHLEAHHQGIHLSDHTLQEKNSFLLRDSGNHMQSDAKRVEDPVITKPSTVYESAGAPIRSEARRSSLNLLVDNVENAFFLDDGGKQVGKSPSEVASFTKEGGDLLQDSVPQEKYQLLRDDGHTVPVSGTQHVDHDGKSKILIDSTTPQEDHLVDNGGKHVQHTGSLKSSKVEEETFLNDNVPQGEYSFLLGDGVWKELHIKELPSLKEEERKNHIKVPLFNKLPLLRGNLQMVVDDSTESMMKNIAHDQIPEAKVGTPNEDNLKMVVGDSSNRMIEKGNRLQACSTSKGSPNVEKLRMVVGDSMIQKGHQGRRGRSRSCSTSNVCRQLADEEYLNHIVLYGRPRRLRSRQPACCGGTCVDLSDNDIHCGICGLPCQLLETCCNGKCVKLDTDDSNCGECGNACPTSSSCAFGLCGYY